MLSNDNSKTIKKQKRRKSGRMTHGRTDTHARTNNKHLKKKEKTGRQLILINAKMKKKRGCVFNFCISVKRERELNYKMNSEI